VSEAYAAGVTTKLPVLLRLLGLVFGYRAVPKSDDFRAKIFEAHSP
jgi:hypothetical protein